MINDLKPGLTGEIINTANVEEIIEVEFAIFLKKRADLLEAFLLNNHRIIAKKTVAVNYGLAKLRLDLSYYVHFVH